MSRGLGKIQKEIMELIEETGATDTDWFCIIGIFETLRVKYRHEWQDVKVDGIDEDAPKKEERRLELVEEMPEGREYQKQYFPIWRAIKSLEKRGLLKVKPVKSKHLFWPSAKIEVSLNRRKS